MQKIILTANGFENKNIGKMFIKMINKEPAKIKAVFVPTAANDADAIEVLPKCLHDLLDLGITPKNIFVYDLHCKMEYDELKKYDAIYFCGGSTSYLLDRINKTDFKTPLKEFVNNGGIYVGVSAGSIVAANNLSGNLGYLNCELDVHGREGINVGEFKPSQFNQVKLPDFRAIIIRDNNYEVIE